MTISILNTGFNVAQSLSLVGAGLNSLQILGITAGVPNTTNVLTPPSVGNWYLTEIFMQGALYDVCNNDIEFSLKGSVSGKVFAYCVPFVSGRFAIYTPFVWDFSSFPLAIDAADTVQFIVTNGSTVNFTLVYTLGLWGFSL